MVRKKIESVIPIVSAELAYVPKETKKPNNLEMWNRFVDALDDLDDVNNFYCTMEYDE